MKAMENPWIKDGRIIAPVGSTVSLPIKFIRPNKKQPRKFFDEVKIAKTAHSIKKGKKVEQAIHITLRDNESFGLIVDGERRFRATKVAKLKEIECYIRPPMTDEEVFLASSRANFDRENMNVLEEALAIYQIQQDNGFNQTQVAEELGKTPGEVGRLLRYLDLNPTMQELLLYQKIDKGTAFKIAGLTLESQDVALQKIKEEIAARDGKPMSVHEVDRLLRREHERGTIHLKKPTRGKKHKSHAELVARHVLSASKAFLEAIREFSELSEEEIAALANPHFLDIEKRLDTTIQNTQKEYGRLTQLA